VKARVSGLAVAFTGAGLALLPVLGVALDALVLQDPALSWLVTSAVAHGRGGRPRTRSTAVGRCGGRCRCWWSCWSRWGCGMDMGGTDTGPARDRDRVDGSDSTWRGQDSERGYADR
jgi:hypothetical protein